MEIRIRRVTGPGDPALPAFGRLQERTFADADLLIPPEVLPQMLARLTPERRNYMLVAELGDDVVGGAVFHYFPAPNTGFSSFLATAPEVRGQGVARRLHQARFALMEEDAGHPVEGVFIDVLAPERMSADEVARERSVGADPVQRRQIFDRMGFRKVDVAYYQPPTGGEPAVTTMDLLYCPRTPAATVRADLVAETMRAYWGPWLGKEAAEAHSRELRRRCGGDQVALLPYRT